jgi:hypothetical protein
VLPSKVDSQLVIADDRPEFAFGNSKFFAQFDGTGSGFRVASGRTRHYFPSLALPNFDVLFVEIGEGLLLLKLKF